MRLTVSLFARFGPAGRFRSYNLAFRKYTGEAILAFSSRVLFFTSSYEWSLHDDHSGMFSQDPRLADRATYGRVFPAFYFRYVATS